jgi:hypothetical protein
MNMNNDQIMQEQMLHEDGLATEEFDKQGFRVKSKPKYAPLDFWLCLILVMRRNGFAV